MTVRPAVTVADLGPGRWDVTIDADGRLVAYQSLIPPPEPSRGLASHPAQRGLATTKEEQERMKAAAAIPVDRSARVLTDGSPVTDDHRELLPSGQQKGYVVLSAEERAKGFVRPVRRTYRHAVSAGGCGHTTTMALSLAETYARDPGFYTGTFCATCGTHFPLDQFVWDGTTEQVGQ